MISLWKFLGLIHLELLKEKLHKNLTLIDMDISGFEVVEKACCSTGTFEMSYLCSDKSPLTCTDASKYVFWDAFHPTDKTNRIVSNYLLIKLLATFN